jgi:broad specificity phosphatase PhoE
MEFPNLDLSLLDENWQAQAGLNAEDDISVAMRAKMMREKFKQMTATLRGNEKRDNVVVTHGMFIKYLSDEEDIDLPKAGWKSYTSKDDVEDKANMMTPVE